VNAVEGRVLHELLFLRDAYTKRWGSGLFRYVEDAAASTVLDHLLGSSGLTPDQRARATALRTKVP